MMGLNAKTGYLATSRMFYYNDSINNEEFLVTKPSLNCRKVHFKYTERIQYCTPTLLSVHYSEGVSEFCFIVKHMQVSIEDIIIFFLGNTFEFNPF